YDVGVSSDAVTVQIGTSNYRATVRAGRHEWIADEPGSLGGADAGPGPYAMLLAALGACKVMTGRMYADRKGWPVRSISCALRHAREAGHERIDVDVEIEGDLTDEQRERVATIIGRCPLHRTLTGDLRIESRLCVTP